MFENLDEANKEIARLGAFEALNTTLTTQLATSEESLVEITKQKDTAETIVGNSNTRIDELDATIQAHAGVVEELNTRAANSDTELAKYREEISNTTIAKSIYDSLLSTTAGSIKGRLKHLYKVEDSLMVDKTMEQLTAMEEALQTTRKDTKGTLVPEGLGLGPDNNTPNLNGVKSPLDYERDLINNAKSK